MRPKTLINALMKAGFSQQGISEFTNITQGHLSNIKAGRAKNPREKAVRALERMYDRRSNKSLSKYRRVNKVRRKA